ncbi:MAG: hydroxypyruvate isomerase [Rhodocyclaceae bacterium]|nr:hydroxypyruvate isomerase [Rhodocyclaceae bacterium]
MLNFSANLSFLFNEQEFVDRFAAAKHAGFTGVEFHFPYAVDKNVLAEVVLTSGLDVVVFNLPAGAPTEWAAGGRGIACHPDRNAEFRAGVALAIEYARALDCSRLNCLAGIPPADVPIATARATLIENLRYAAVQTKQAGMVLLLEPLNSIDNPGFLVSTTAQALQIIDAVGSDNLYLQYDIYHAQMMEGNLATTLQTRLPRIGHIQLADVPGRHEPGSGEINFAFLFSALVRASYAGWIGCEYLPSAGTEASLSWLNDRLKPRESR